MKKRIIAFSLLATMLIGSMPIISIASSEAPTLNAYQLNNGVKLEWAIEMNSKDILTETGFETGDEMPQLNDAVPPSNIQRYHGGQSFSTKEKYSGNSSLMINNTIKNSNYQTVRPNGDIIYSNSSRAGLPNRRYMANGTDLSVSFIAKSTGSGTITPGGRGSKADFGSPITGVYFTQDVKPGDKTVKVNDVTIFKNAIANNTYSYIADRKGDYNYIVVDSVNVSNSTITMRGIFGGSFKKGDSVLRHNHRNPVTFPTRTINSNKWELYNINTKVLNYEDYNNLLRGFAFGLTTKTGDIVYVDDLKFGYATKAELYRGSTKIYEGFLSDYEDKAATDKVKPNKVDKATLTYKGGNAILDITKPSDVGSIYTYQVMSVNHQGSKTPSAKKDVTVTTGVQGYSYAIDKNPSTIPGTKIQEKSNKITVPITSNEKHYLHVRAIDGNGNASDVTHYEIQDAIAPTLKLSVSNTNPTNKNVVINVTSSDTGLGVKEIVLPDNTIKTGSSASFTIDKNGKYSFMARDFAGNTATEDIEISNINKVLPVITIEDYNKAPTNKDIVVNASVDKGSLNEESYTFTENGSFTFTASDIYGNVAEAKTIVITNIDKVAPSKPTAERDNHVLKLTSGNDEQSGIKKALYSIDNSEWLPLVNQVDLSNFDDGNYEVRVRTIDMAGNESTATLMFVITYKEEFNEINLSIDKINTNNGADISNLEEELNSIQKEIEKMPDNDKKQEAQDKMDTARHQLKEEILDRLASIGESIKDILFGPNSDLNEVEAELDKIQEDINKLPIVEGRETLQSELDKKKADVAKEEARRVEKIKSELEGIIIGIDNDISGTINDLDNLQEEIDKLPKSDKRQEAQESLGGIRTQIEKEVSNRIDKTKDKFNNIITNNWHDFGFVKEEIDKLYEQVSKLPSGKEKDNIKEILDNKMSELEEDISKKVNETTNSINNLRPDEGLGLEALVEFDKVIEDIQRDIDNLPKGEKRDRLQDDIDKKKNEIKNLKEEKAKDSINNITNGNELEDILNEIESSGLDKEAVDELLEKLQDKVVFLAERYTKIAEAYRRDPHINNANVFINFINNVDIKLTLETRLSELKAELKENSPSAIKSATNILEKAERTKSKLYIDTARKMIEKLKPSIEKNEFMTRLEALELS